VNLGVHLDFLPVVGGAGAVSLKEMTVAHCDVKKRLAPDPDLDDYWWAYEDAGARQTLIATLETKGFPFFGDLESFPDYWLKLSPEDLRAATFGAKLPGMTRVRAALLLARLHAFLGNWQRCHEFAEYGLGIVPALAAGPKRAFKELLAQRPA